MSANDTRLALLVASADDSEDAGIIHRAGAALGVDAYALDAAERTGLVEARGATVRFRHPLVRSAVYGAATASERREVHRALASALAGEEEHADHRAWHLASSAIGQDEDAVRALDAAAQPGGAGGPQRRGRVLERAAESPTRRAGPQARRRSLGNEPCGRADDRAAAPLGAGTSSCREPVRRAAIRNGTRATPSAAHRLPSSQPRRQRRAHARQLAPADGDSACYSCSPALDDLVTP